MNNDLETKIEKALNTIQNFNLEKFANNLDGRQRGDELTEYDIKIAKELGYVIVFCYSDDTCFVEGAVQEEIGCYDGGSFHINKNGIPMICEHECIYYLNEIEKSKKVNIYWCEDSEFRWELETQIPHVDFNIYDGDEGFCRGIVFKLTDI